MSILGIAAAQDRQTRVNNAEFEFQQHKKSQQTQKEFVETAQASIGAAGIIINELEGKLKKARKKIDIYGARATALLAEVQELKAEAETCPAQNHHTLIKVTVENKLVIDDVYDRAFAKKGKENDLTDEEIEEYTTNSPVKKY